MPCRWLSIGTFLGNTLLSSDNSPANDRWTMYLIYVENSEEKYVQVTFLPTSEIDMTSNPYAAGNISLASTLLAPSFSGLRSLNPQITIDILKMVNWGFVSAYWLSLYDFGQLVPMTYEYTTSSVNFSSPIIYSSTNNIFLNDTLFQIYSSYLRDVMMPIFRGYLPAGPLPEFLPLDENNRLEPRTSTMLKSYSCTERERKGLFSFIFSVLAADYGLIAGGYTIMIYIAGLKQKRKDKGKSTVRKSSRYRKRSPGLQSQVETKIA